MSQSFVAGSAGIVCFSHGKESGPWGLKITALAAIAEMHGWEVVSLDYRDMEDPLARINKLLEWRATLPPDKYKKVVLVGSSMGAAVSAAAAARCNVDALFLMATAVYVPGYEHLHPASLNCPVTMIHGWRDEIIPYANALRFALETKARYLLIDGDHGLAKQLPRLEEAFTVFLLDNE